MFCLQEYLCTVSVLGDRFLGTRVRDGYESWNRGAQSSISPVPRVPLFLKVLTDENIEYQQHTASPSS